MGGSILTKHFNRTKNTLKLWINFDVWQLDISINTCWYKKKNNNGMYSFVKKSNSNCFYLSIRILAKFASDFTDNLAFKSRQRSSSFPIWTRALWNSQLYACWVFSSLILSPLTCVFFSLSDRPPFFQSFFISLIFTSSSLNIVNVRKLVFLR